MRVRLVYVALASVVSLFGCFGLAHVAEETAPLVVQGVLFDEDGEPLSDQSLLIALSTFYGQPETLAALATGAADPAAHAYQHCLIQTGSSGEFSCRFQGESRYIGFMPPLMSTPSKELRRSLVVGVRTANGTVFVLQVQGEEVEIRVPTGVDSKLEKPIKLPIRVSAAATRSEMVDVLQLVLVLQPSAA